MYIISEITYTNSRRGDKIINFKKVNTRVENLREKSYYYRVRVENLKDL